MKLGPTRICKFRRDMRPNAGSFATSTRFVEQGKGRWTLSGFATCRDTFYTQFTPQQQNIIFVYQSEAERENIAALLWKVEDMLHVTPHTRMGPTNRNWAMWVKCAPFWLEEGVRRSFLTALLRAGRTYNVAQDNFNHAIESQYYFGQTMPAVKRFLAGFTHLATNNNGQGWWQLFNGKSEKEVASLLVAPALQAK